MRRPVLAPVLLAGTGCAVANHSMPLVFPHARPLSDVLARYVLELPTGTARRIGTQTGAELTVEGDIGMVR